MGGGCHFGDVKRRDCCLVDSIFSAYCGVPSLAGSKVRKAEGLGRLKWMKEKVKVRSRDHQEAPCGLDSQHE